MSRDVQEEWGWTNTSSAAVTVPPAPQLQLLLGTQFKRVSSPSCSHVNHLHLNPLSLCVSGWRSSYAWLEPVIWLACLWAVRDSWDFFQSKNSSALWSLSWSSSWTHSVAAPGPYRGPRSLCVREDGCVNMISHVVEDLLFVFVCL